MEDASAANRTGTAPSPRQKGASAEWHLQVDTSVLADSNVTNSSRERKLARGRDAALPVPVDSGIRARADIGGSLAVSGGVELPIHAGLWLVADADVYALDYGGGDDDYLSANVSAGPLLRWDGGEASVQLLAFESWYGGTAASAGSGIRGRYQVELSPGNQIVLAADARFFHSDYGADFGGTQGGLYLTYQSVLDSVTSAAAGVYARADWLQSEAYSNRELGGYAGLTRYIGSDLTGSLSAGISRVRFEAPVLFLSPREREDWRLYATASVTTRRPIGWGIRPSVSYNYNLTRSSTPLFNAARHRLRVGVARTF